MEKQRGAMLSPKYISNLNMRMDTLIRVHRLGRAMHPELTLTNIRHQIFMLGRAALNFSAIRQWFEISDNPLLTQAVQRFPLISGAIYWPYINYAWPMKRRLEIIDRHFRMLGGTAAIIAHATFENVELARLDEEYNRLRLVLDKASWFVREGEIVLNLFIDDRRFYSIAFTLGLDAGQPIAIVGALQGSNIEDAREIYRNITHALHGLRPRDLLITALKLLCRELGIHRIWAISNEYAQHHSPYFGKSLNDKVLVAYNDVWLEHGGVPLDNGFFEIPAMVRYREASDIPTRKRAMYRRRYMMLDKLALQIKAACAWHAAQSPAKTALTQDSTMHARQDTT